MSKSVSGEVSNGQEQTLSLREGSNPDPVQLPEATASQEELLQQWRSYQKSLQHYFKKFHPEQTVIDATQPLPHPQSHEDTLRQEELYKQWLCYMQAYYTFKSNMEKPQRQATTSSEVFSKEEMDLLENVPGIIDLAKDMGFLE